MEPRFELHKGGGCLRAVSLCGGMTPPSSLCFYIHTLLILLSMKVKTLKTIQLLNNYRTSGNVNDENVT